MNKTTYYFGLKNQRKLCKLYKKVYKEENPVHKETWWVADIVRGKFNCWQYCNILPVKMEETTKQKAEEYLFEYCL